MNVMHVKEGHDSKGKNPALQGNRIRRRAQHTVDAQQTDEQLTCQEELKQREQDPPYEQGGLWLDTRKNFPSGCSDTGPCTAGESLLGETDGLSSVS